MVRNPVELALWILALFALVVIGINRYEHREAIRKERARKAEEQAYTPVMNLKQQQDKWNAMTPEERKKAEDEIARVNERARSTSDFGFGTVLAVAAAVAIGWRIYRLRNTPG